MSLPGWLNANSSRTFPLEGVAQPLLSALWGDVPLPDDAVLDAGFSAFLPTAASDRAVLRRVERPATNLIRFVVGSTASSLGAHDLTFSAAVDGPEFTVMRASASVAPEDEACDAAPAWEGFLTVGNLAVLAARIPVGSTLTGPCPFEPALLRPMAGLLLRSISLANEDRTRWTPGPSCGGAGEAPERPYVVAARCLAGPLALVPGYNCAITQNTRANSITIAAEVGGGAGLPCAEVPLTDEEAALPAGILLSGGPACGEAVSMINGVVGPDLVLVGGTGVQVSADPDDESGLIVDVNLFDLDTCGQPA